MSWVRVGAAVAARPELWGTAIRQMSRTAAPGWWKRPPFLPVPSGGYLKFRLVTQYGNSTQRPEPHDVVNYLAWCKRWERLSSR
jgi:hypothetical protein